MIDVRGVGKTFHVPREPHSRVKDLVLHPGRGAGYDTFRSLEDVTFDVPQGEFFGVVGRNGSGKSTLLRCLCGIYRQDRGTIDVRGRIAPVIDLGVGFNAEMTARDNALVLAIVLGLSPREARRRLAEIFEFAELSDFVGARLKNYSAGMVVRLAFAVAIQVDAEVLAFDEVLAVGDGAFQQKCIERFQQFKDEGRTVVLVTHDMAAVERFCDRAMLLDRGRVVAIDTPSAVVRGYRELNAGGGPIAEPAVAAGGGGSATIAGAWVEDAAGRRVDGVDRGAQCALCMEVVAREALDGPTFELVLLDGAGHAVFRTSSEWPHGPTGSFEPQTSTVVRVRLENRLAPGRYSLSATVSSGSGEWLDQRDDAASLTVYGPGVARLPHASTGEQR